MVGANDDALHLPGLFHQTYTAVTAHVVENTQLAVLRAHEEVVMSAVFSPSGEQILTDTSLSGGMDMRLFDVPASATPGWACES